MPVSTPFTMVASAWRLAIPVSATSEGPNHEANGPSSSIVATPRRLATKDRGRRLAEGMIQTMTQEIFLLRVT
jgi:hypothetical protein